MTNFENTIFKTNKLIFFCFLEPFKMPRPKGSKNDSKSKRRHEDVADENPRERKSSRKATRSNSSPQKIVKNNKESSDIMEDFEDENELIQQFIDETEKSSGHDEAEDDVIDDEFEPTSTDKSDATTTEAAPTNER
jgi:hypothetical protein